MPRFPDPESFYFSKSGIPNAGEGLFTLVEFQPGDYLGEYTEKFIAPLMMFPTTETMCLKFMRKAPPVPPRNDPVQESVLIPSLPMILMPPRVPNNQAVPKVPQLEAQVQGNPVNLMNHRNLMNPRVTTSQASQANQANQTKSVTHQQDPANKQTKQT
ncbi:unnamed protein product [Sphagnum jensenii]|uniref:Uncharacterized protein n=1 Tax=Sphagnum jensenii TaxID=128206 RepID=A0ABP1A0Z9_9BRYO